MSIFSTINLLLFRKKISPYINHEIYLSLIHYKNVKKIKDTVVKEEKIMENELNKSYDYYYYAMKNLDSVKNKGIKYFEVKKQHSYGKNKFLDLDYKKSKIIKLFNVKNEKDLSLEKRYAKQNIIEEHIKDLKSRKVSKTLVEPYYFFTARYNEKSKPSQIKH